MTRRPGAWALVFALLSGAALADERPLSGSVHLPPKVANDRRRVFATDGKTILAEVPAEGTAWSLRVPGAPRWLVAEVLPPLRSWSGVPWLAAGVTSLDAKQLELPDTVTLEVSVDDTARYDVISNVGLWLNAVALDGVPPEVLGLLKRNMNDDLALAFLELSAGAKPLVLHVQRGRYTITGGRFAFRSLWDDGPSIACSKITDLDTGEVIPCVQFAAEFPVARSRRLRVSFVPKP